MTHNDVRVLPDGTRVYSDYHRYKPVPQAERVKGVRKPDHPEAVRFHGQWFLPLVLAEDSARVMPATRPDSEAYEHADRPCRCDVCKRPAAEKFRAKYRRDHGIKS